MSTTERNMTMPNPASVAGELPERVNTLQARILAKLIEGSALTGLESVFRDSTTRLAAVVHFLQKEYGWHCVKVRKAATTRDGRKVSVTEYCLSQEARIAAFDAGASDWIESVKQAQIGRVKSF